MRVPDEAGLGKAKVTVSFPGWKKNAVTPTTFEVPVLNPEQHLRLKRETILKSLKELEKENGRQYDQIKRAWQQELEQIEATLKSLKPAHKEPPQEKPERPKLDPKKQADLNEASGLEYQRKGQEILGPGASPTINRSARTWPPSRTATADMVIDAMRPSSSSGQRIELSF